MTNVYVAVVPAPARDREGVRDGRRARRAAGCSSASAPGTSKASSTRSACRSPSAARSPTRRSTRSSLRGPTSGRRTTGRAGSTREVGQRPRPVQQPHPPIWIGGSGKPALRRVARVGDGWIPQATPPDRLGRRHRVHPARATACGRAPCPRSATTRTSTSATPTWELPEVRDDGNDRIVDWINELGRDRRIARAGPLCRAVGRRAVRPGRRAFGAEIGPHLTRRVERLSEGTSMPYLCMRHDFRAPAFGPASTRRSTRPRSSSTSGPTATASTCSCSPSTTASTTAGCPRRSRSPASCSARTEAARVIVSASILPLHDPVRVAEQIAVLDNAAPGRLVGGRGRRLPGRGVRDGRHRARGARPGARGVRRRCCCRRGRASRSSGAGGTMTVTPQPATQPHPMMLVGGGVPGRGRGTRRGCGSRCCR